MLQIFRENFQRCLEVFHSEIASDSKLLSLLPPFYGLHDQSVYESWKINSDLRYFEASNLIHYMAQHPGLPDDMQKLAQDFIDAGYDSLSSPDFGEDLIKEQLKLIYMILRGETNSLS
jgi:hypothetical protein